MFTGYVAIGIALPGLLSGPHVSCHNAEPGVVYPVKECLDFTESLGVLGYATQSMGRPFLDFPVSNAKGAGDVNGFIGDFFGISGAFFKSGLNTTGDSIHPAIVCRSGPSGVSVHLKHI